MAQRQVLHDLFKTFVENVYFQPGTNVKLTFPCIVYQRYAEKTEFAENKPYLLTDRYQVTIIDPDPDSLIPKMVASLPMCTKNRFFVVDNLNHDVYNLYF